MAHPFRGTDRAWFVRVKKGRRCELRPHARAGWLITVLFALAVAGFSLLLLARDEPSVAALIAWGVLTAAMTAAFLLIAWRSSVRIDPGPDACGAKGWRSDPRLALVASVLAALALIGAALIGVEL